MTDKKSSEKRRKLLKSIAAGSGAIVAGKSLPDSWSKPVVDSVILPAHAQTSPAPPDSPAPPTSGLTGIFITSEQITADSSAGGTVDLAIAVCSDIVNNVAAVTGVVGSVQVNETGIAVPGTTSISSAGVIATIGLISVSGTAPNRQLTVSVELSGNLTFGPQNFTSPESQSCPT